MNNTPAPDDLLDVVIVGAGAAGVGVSVALAHAGIENFVALERHSVGASFAQWPAETRFITPSFPTNSVGMLDLNSVVIGTSAAWSLEVEHPTGRQYAAFLKAIAGHFELPIQEGVDVLRIDRSGEEFVVETTAGPVRARHVIWAAGDFQYPRLNSFEGSELCLHTALLPSYAELDGDDFIVVGGYESGVDVASHLAERGKRVRLFDLGSPWASESSDPSVALSTFSLERTRRPSYTERVELFPDTAVTAVATANAGFEVATADGQRFRTPVQPLLAGGFAGSHPLVMDLFESREDGFPLLNEHDGSTVVPGIYLCGAAVRHESHIFCFIYKYRQRFAVVAKAIATSLGLPAEELEMYRMWGMYLDDLSCCGQECVC
ncbi:MAG: SidA/IucD/PvdA family monooxygenase [Gemmatimonadales bacterium]|nr:SidA/IucD/PvdA family monooxygenase [Candidatus Palauibacter irciniicola]MYC18930.1 SidA/IucD/PvdA family monooxygenase [Gemmatimonadales bacterium]